MASVAHRNSEHEIVGVSVESVGRLSVRRMWDSDIGVRAAGDNRHATRHVGELWIARPLLRKDAIEIRLGGYRVGEGNGVGE